MNIKELKEFIKDLPDEMPLLLVDLTTDDSYNGIYAVEENNLDIADTFKNEECTEPNRKAMIISFENKLNENPI